MRGRPPAAQLGGATVSRRPMALVGRKPDDRPKPDHWIRALPPLSAPSISPPLRASPRQPAKARALELGPFHPHVHGALCQPLCGISHPTMRSAAYSDATPGAAIILAPGIRTNGVIMASAVFECGLSSPFMKVALKKVSLIDLESSGAEPQECQQHCKDAQEHWLSGFYNL